jgi:ATP-dependent DNA helicase RecQ
MISQQDFQKLKFDTLKYFWGYDGFRDSQEEIIDSVINEKDTLVLCLQEPENHLLSASCFVKEGTCLVISPLLALMKDQVNQLKSRGIEAEYLSSELDEYDAENIYNRCKEGLTKMLMFLLKD